jgi:hypothetical protein
MPADAGDHFRRDPLAEGFRLGLPAGKDQGVKAGFGDGGNLLPTARGMCSTPTPFVGVQGVYGLVVIRNPQDFANVPGHEPCLPILARDNSNRLAVENEGQGLILGRRQLRPQDEPVDVGPVDDRHAPGVDSQNRRFAGSK